MFDDYPMSLQADWSERNNYVPWTLPDIPEGFNQAVPPVVNTSTSVEEPEATFYIIWCQESEFPPKNKFHLSQAIKVIANMRRKYPNQTFHIMAKVDE